MAGKPGGGASGFCALGLLPGPKPVANAGRAGGLAAAAGRGVAEVGLQKQQDASASAHVKGGCLAAGVQLRLGNTGQVAAPCGARGPADEPEPAEIAKEGTRRYLRIGARAFMQHAHCVHQRAG